MLTTFNRLPATDQVRLALAIHILAHKPSHKTSAGPSLFTSLADIGQQLARDSFAAPETLERVIPILGRAFSVQALSLEGSRRLQPACAVLRCILERCSQARPNDEPLAAVPAAILRASVVEPLLQSIASACAEAERGTTGAYNSLDDVVEAALALLNVGAPVPEPALDLTRAETRAPFAAPLVLAIIVRLEVGAFGDPQALSEAAVVVLLGLLGAAVPLLPPYSPGDSVDKDNVDFPRIDPHDEENPWRALDRLAGRLPFAEDDGASAAPVRNALGRAWLWEGVLGRACEEAAVDNLDGWRSI